jgi:hypothetical protein
MGLRAQHLVDDGALQLVDELGEKDDHRHATRHAGQDQRALHAALAQKAQRHQQLERHPARLRAEGGAGAVEAEFHAGRRG